MNLRRFVSRFAFLPPVAALVLASMSVAGCAESLEPAPSSSSEDVTSPSPAPAPAAPLETFTSDAAGFDTHSFWLDTGSEVVVFDAQFTESYAEQLIAQIRAKTHRPIRWVVVTHPNPDKFNGATAFQKIGARVVASESTKAAIPGVHAYKKNYFVNVAHTFTEETYPAEASIDVTFRGDLDLPLEGGAKVHLHELVHRGVSSTQTVAIIPARSALVVGDLVHVRAHAWLEGGIVDGQPTPDLASWSSALDELLDLPSSLSPGATVYGGRGETADIETAVAAEKAYLDRMNRLVASYVDGLGPAKSELFGPELGTHAKTIAALAEQAFPDYALDYMIEYGVYGLAQQLAR
jgi:glyoxylase-like metal-dependent hydrolase (beta-lactamase superfamily II)